MQRADAIGLRYALAERVEGFNISIGRPVMLTIFRSVENAMTRGQRHSPRRAARNRRCAAARPMWRPRLRPLTRPVRSPSRDPWAIAAAAGDHRRRGASRFPALHDPARRAAHARRRPICRAGSIWSFDQITDFGKSGWFLWPLGILFLALAALPAPAAHARNCVLAAVMVRVGFLFTAIAVPGLFDTIIKRMIGRARPMVGGSLDPFVFSPFNWTRRLCQPAVGPRHHRLFGAGRVRLAVAARAHRVAGSMRC